MKLIFKAVEGEAAYRIDAVALNNELAAALGGWCNVAGWNASHTATEAVVDIDDETKADTVRQVVEDHIANTAKREHNAGVLAEITALEATVTQRMLRDAALGDTTRLKAVNAQIAALRAQLQ